MNKAFFISLSFFVFCGLLCGQSITITNPHGGETWHVGSTYEITWTKSGQMDQNVKIRLHQGSTHILDITNSTTNDGSFSWTVPTSVAAGSYKIRVRTLDNAVAGDSQAFTVSAMRQISRPLPDRPRPLFGAPSLAISNFELSPNADGFVITFGYKNVGTAALPKGSQMPVKPTFRVLIDGREINKGNLYIPEFAAPPGWEVKTYHGGTIKYPTGQGMDYNFHVGNMVTVHINENKAGGMESDSETYNLRQLALRHSYDAVLMTPYLNWTGKILVVDIRIDGVITSDKEFMLLNSAYPCEFHTVVKFNPYQRNYTITRKMDCLAYRDEYWLDLYLIIRRVGSDVVDHKDIDQRNNHFTKTYTR